MSDQDERQETIELLKQKGNRHTAVGQIRAIQTRRKACYSVKLLLRGVANIGTVGLIADWVRGED